MHMINLNERYVAGPESNQWPLDSQSDSLSTLGDSAAMYTWAASWQNQQNCRCVQRRLRSAWASAQSDQSLRCPHEETWDTQLPIERTAKTLIRLGDSQADLSLRWAQMLVGFVMMWPSYSESTSISSLVASEINHILKAGLPSAVDSESDCRAKDR